MSHNPDRLEKAFRFGCGGLLGLLLGLFLSIKFFYMLENRILSIIIIGITVVLCGLAAMEKGDRFWYSLKDLRIPWWR